MEYIIRRADKSDVVALSSLFKEFIGTDSNLSEMEKVIDKISTNEDYYVFVICNEMHNVIGTAMSIVCFEIVGNCNPYLLVENVVVSSEYRGQGIGRLLMEAVDDFALRKNCNYIMLVSGNNREEAHRFYESIGYTNVGRGFKKRFMKQV